jgi:transposase
MEELDLDALRSTYAGRGSRPHRPDLLLKLLAYEHDQGRPQPTQWRKHLLEDKPVQWLVFGIKPSLTSLYEFRDRVQPLLEALNDQGIRIAIDAKLTTASCAALDGTTVAANASRHRLLSLETVEKRLGQLEQQISAAEAADEAGRPCEGPSPADGCATETTSSSESPAPGVVTALPSFMGKTLRGQKRQRHRYRRAREILRARHQVNAKRRKDKRKTSAQIRLAIGDSSAPPGLDKLKVYRPLYNVQLMSDVETDLVLAYATLPTTTDSGQLVAMIDRTNQATRKTLAEVLADAGYPSGQELAECEQRGVTVFAPWNENAFTEAKRAKGRGRDQIPQERFTFDPSIPGYRCPEGKVLRYHGRTTKQKANGECVPRDVYQASPSDCAVCPLKAQCVRSGSGARTVRRQDHQEQIDALKERMSRPEGKRKYRDRCCTVERRFADFKTRLGLQRISGQTPERAEAQVGLTVLAHNLRMIAKLRKRREHLQKNPGKVAS